SVIKSLQSRIEEIRNQMRELAKNEDLDPKAKADKKAEMQKQISELQAQIRQRQAEIREEKMQPTEQSKQRQAEKQAEQEAKQQAKTGVKAAISKTGANAFLAADNAMDISKTHGKVANALTGRARELAAELRSDSSRGAATEQKQEELAKVTARAQKAKGEQVSALGKANKELNNAAEIDAKTKEKAKADKNSQDEEKIKIEGRYERDGSRIDEKDPDKREYEDRA
ncbi:MAG: hypothetical protein K2N36_07685, partial [Ruminiclostridium sp.]|nr:hypothetical protein [Ruminiclostridium sp.]